MPNNAHTTILRSLLNLASYIGMSLSFPLNNFWLESEKKPFESSLNKRDVLFLSQQTKINDFSLHLFLDDIPYFLITMVPFEMLDGTARKK